MLCTYIPFFANVSECLVTTEAVVRCELLPISMVLYFTNSMQGMNGMVHCMV